MSPSGTHHDWAEALGAALEDEPTDARRLAGGCVGDVYRVTLASGGERCVVKVDAGADARLDIEGAMLELLSERSSLPVPRVLHSSPALLAMEYIENSGSGTSDGEEGAARLIADLHAIAPGAGESGFGLGFDTLIGGLHQPNAWAESWAQFFAERRLCEMARRCADAGRLDPRTAARIESLASRITDLVPADAQPSLLHGDIWGGNVLWRDGRIAAFIDPAVYFGHAEIELAFITMFSTFSQRFFDAYNELRPIEPGFWEERRDLYNLYPLLVHVRLFGGGYADSVRRTLGRFGA